MLTHLLKPTTEHYYILCRHDLYSDNPYVHSYISPRFEPVYLYHVNFFQCNYSYKYLGIFPEVPRIFRKSSMKYTILSVALFSADILKRALLGFHQTHIMPQYPQNKHPNDIM